MTIKCFHPSITIPKNSYFIQSRGLHSGRPLRKPIPNCFIVTLTSQEEVNQHFSLTEALFTLRRFEPFIFGTAVPLIRIRDVKAVLDQGKKIVDRDPDAFEKVVRLSLSIDAHIDNLKNQVDVLSSLKKAHLHKFLTAER